MGKKRGKDNGWFGWFDSSRRKFIKDALWLLATTTTIISNLETILSGRPNAPVEPVKISSSDRISVNVVVTPVTGTASFGTTNPVVVIS